MELGQFLAIVASLIGGGAMGAVITALVNSSKNERQPVSYTREVIDVLRKNPHVPSLQAMLRLGEAGDSGQDAIQVQNLSVARISVRNNGNEDLKEFEFGITLEEGTKAVDVKTEAPDRHHLMKALTEVTLMAPKSEVDFQLRPFNRGDEYKASMNLIFNDAPGEIRLSTAHSSTFVENRKSSGGLSFGWGLLIFVLVVLVLIETVFLFVFTTPKQ